MRIIYLLFIFTLFQCGSAKTPQKIVEGNPHKKEIKTTLDTYMEKFQAGDYEAMLDLTYPKLFEIAPKEAMLNVLKSTFDSEEIKISIPESEILKVHDTLVTRSDTLYTLVDYKMTMQMKLKGETADAVDFMIPTFNEQFGEENVHYNPETTTFTIKSNNQMVAIRAMAKWYFLENRKGPNERMILEKTIDAGVLKELGI